MRNSMMHAIEHCYGIIFMCRFVTEEKKTFNKKLVNRKIVVPSQTDRQESVSICYRLGHSIGVVYPFVIQMLCAKCPKQNK